MEDGQSESQVAQRPETQASSSMDGIPIGWAPDRPLPANLPDVPPSGDSGDTSQLVAVAKATAKVELQAKEERVRIKKEQAGASGAEAAKSKPKAKAKAKGKAKASAKAKAVLRTKKASHGFKKGQDHYRFQIGFIEQMVPPPWKVVFSALGTGFVGVTPDGSSSSSAKLEVKKEEVKQESTDVKEECPEGALPANCTIIVFVNAPAMALQARNGKVITNYREGLDLIAKTMKWSSQRSDQRNVRIGRIMEHFRRGGRVVVAVREGPSCDFQLLGQVSSISNYEPAQFLAEDGDHLLLEAGTRTVHKAINASCLHAGLTAGVGLQSVQYGKMNFKPRYCCSCCYRPASCVFHFSVLEAGGVAAFEQPMRRIREAKREMGEDTEEPPSKLVKPLTRIKTKTPASQVKVEVIDDTPDEGGSHSSSLPASAPQAPLQRVQVKHELSQDQGAVAAQGGCHTLQATTETPVASEALAASDAPPAGSSTQSASTVPAVESLIKFLKRDIAGMQTS
mmetsp:Transcript_49149/g.117083  ORF Transcript_49149/g.117083 Transcript_49149/m.117083 type:complete len:509 (-) Transcript_49149:175-1701(-)